MSHVEYSKSSSEKWHQQTLCPDEAIKAFLGIPPLFNGGNTGESYKYIGYIIGLFKNVFFLQIFMAIQ